MGAELPKELAREVRQTLADLRVAHLAGTAWPVVAGDNRAAAYVAATKPTPALPLVGAVSGAILILVGYLLGGWLVAAGTGVFAAFIFGVAYAGTHTNRERIERRHAQALAPTKERTEPVPSVVAEAIDKIEALVRPSS